MRKTFLLSSILLLFIGMALANAPPVTFDTDSDQGETIENFTFNQSDVSQDAVAIEVNQIASPIIGDSHGSPVVTLTVNPGTLDVRLDVNTSAEAIQGTLNDRNLYATVERSQLSLANLNNHDNSEDKNLMNQACESEVFSTNEYHTI